MRLYLDDKIKEILSISVTNFTKQTEWATFLKGVELTVLLDNGEERTLQVYDFYDASASGNGCIYIDDKNVWFEMLSVLSKPFDRTKIDTPSHFVCEYVYGLSETTETLTFDVVINVVGIERIECNKGNFFYQLGSVIYPFTLGEFKVIDTLGRELEIRDLTQYEEHEQEDGVVYAYLERVMILPHPVGMLKFVLDDFYNGVELEKYQPIGFQEALPYLYAIELRIPSSEYGEEYVSELVNFYIINRDDERIEAQCIYNSLSVGTFVNYNLFKVKYFSNCLTNRAFGGEPTVEYSKQVFNFDLDYSGTLTNDDIPNKTFTIIYEGIRAQLTIPVVGLGADNAYYFDKVAPYNRHLFGEIEQNGFNMNFVLDGTKKSAKVVVYNDISEELKPNTIIYLESTNTWWKVEKDTAKRIPAEIGAIWKHEMQLLGCADILNSRDLTSIGFNRERYTIEQYINRIFAMSDYEFKNNIQINTNGNIDLEAKVDFVKTYDNYNPYTALREFLSAYNCEFDLNMITNNANQIVGCVVDIMSKSGNNVVINETEFTDVREYKSSSTDNYGTKVISNAENVVSRGSVIYPALGSGGLYLTSNESKVTRQNGILRLPSKIFKVNGIKIMGSTQIIFNTSSSGQGDAFIIHDVYSKLEEETLFNKMRDYFVSKGMTFTREEFDRIVYPVVRSYGVIELKNGGKYNFEKQLWEGDTVLFNCLTAWTEHGFEVQIGLNEKKFENSAPHKWKMVNWEIGGDSIYNFEFFYHTTTNDATSTFDKSRQTEVDIVLDNGGIVAIFQTQVNAVGMYRAQFYVDYVPMDDIKIKVDNNNYENDTRIYNQNGKMNDANAISKLINSYAVSVNSNEITRFKRFYNYVDVYKVGTIVMLGGEKYVINNASLNFAENDNNHYVIDAEFSLTKQNACKSIMVNANSNIRDYKCPQENNIIRKQLYRDYVEFGYTQEGDNSSYSNLAKFFNFEAKNYYHIALIQFNNETCAKLSTTNYNLSKQHIEILKLMDNNIVGYGYAQLFVIPLITQWWDFYEDYNVPVSYTDEYGEVGSINIALLDTDQYLNVISEYADEYEIDVSKLFNLQLSVSNEMFSLAQEEDVDTLVEEPTYNKDGLEVPQFEFVVQVGDANGIVFGDRCLENREEETNEIIEYQYARSETEITAENSSLIEVSQINNDGTNYGLSNKAEFSYNNGILTIALKSVYLAEIGSRETITSVKDLNLILHENIAFYRVHYYWKENRVVRELLFAINDCQVERNANGEFSLYVNSYKLK